MSKPKDFTRLWLEIETELFHALNFDAVERVLYYFFFVSTHIMGRRNVCLSIAQITKGTQLSTYTVYYRLKNLRAKGCLRAHRRNHGGTVWEVPLPRQILGPKRHRGERRPWEADFLDSRADRRARKAILLRERSLCFYCLRKITSTTAVLDHVVPRSQGGGSSYKNLVACCPECNSNKGTTPASTFLRVLMRKGRLTSTEFNHRLSALASLTRGQLRLTSYKRSYARYRRAIPDKQQAESEERSQRRPRGSKKLRLTR